MRKAFITVCAALGYAAAMAQEVTPEVTPLEEPEKTPMEKLDERTSNLELKMDKLGKLKFSGYIQAQYQYAQEKGSTKVGNSTNEKTGTEDDGDGFGRFGVRRGRMKAAYANGLTSAVFEIDITEKGFATKNAYFNVKDPWIKTCSFQAGIFDRPFGYELGYSSNQRESPEYSTFCTKLFPDEKDLGAMLTLAPAKESPLNFLKLKAGVFAGNGMKQDSKSKRDFIGKLQANKNIGSDGFWELGVSYYQGGVYQGTKYVYEMDDASFVVDSTDTNLGEYAKRQYMGIDGVLNLSSNIGMTKLMAEYVFGQQPGTAKSTKSPNDNSNPKEDTYIRKFNGFYVMLVQDLGRSPFSLVAKYDAYDPNTKVKKNDVGLNGTTKADLSQNTLGLGLIWRAMNNLKFTAYYEWNNNEKTDNVSGYNENVKDNLFTLRAQYKF